MTRRLSWQNYILTNSGVHNHMFYFTGVCVLLPRSSFIVSDISFWRSFQIRFSLLISFRLFCRPLQTLLSRIFVAVAYASVRGQHWTQTTSTHAHAALLTSDMILNVLVELERLYIQLVKWCTHFMHLLRDQCFRPGNELCSAQWAFLLRATCISSALSMRKKVFSLLDRCIPRMFQRQTRRKLWRPFFRMRLHTVYHFKSWNRQGGFLSNKPISLQKPICLWQQRMPKNYIFWLDNEDILFNCKNTFFSACANKKMSEKQNTTGASSPWWFVSQEIVWAKCLKKRGLDCRDLVETRFNIKNNYQQFILKKKGIEVALRRRASWRQRRSRAGFMCVRKLRCKVDVRELLFSCRFSSAAG